MEMTLSNERTMSSLDIAEITGKQHKHVMEAIRKMENGWIKTGGSNFRLASYIDAQGKPRPCYQLKMDECLFVSTKFNDESRARLVKRWKELETGQAQPMVAQPQQNAVVPKTGAELMLMYAQQMVEQERKINLIEDKTNQQEQRLTEIEARINGTVPYTTIVGFANRYGIRMPRERASALGHVAVNLCKKYGFEMGRVEDPRFGMVRTYPDGVLSETFSKYYPNITF